MAYSFNFQDEEIHMLPRNVLRRFLKCDVERQVVPDGGVRNRKRRPADCRETTCWIFRFVGRRRVTFSYYTQQRVYQLYVAGPNRTLWCACVDNHTEIFHDIS